MTKVRIVVYKAVVVDKDYGSVSYEELQRVKEAIALYTKGLELSRSCDALLAAARQTVEMGKMQLEDEINDLE